MARNLRSLLVSILGLRHGRNQKQIGAGAGMSQKQVSFYLRQEHLEDDILERLLAGTDCRPAEIPIVTACLEALDALERNQELTPEEREEVETGVLEVTRLLREILTEAARQSRTIPAFDDYPKPAELEPARWHAGVVFSLLEGFTEDQRLAAVRVAREIQSWALVERLCEESAVQASQDLERAASLARLARDAAERVRGPEGWRRRLQGLAAAHVANILRVAGELKGAEEGIETAKRLWQDGADPDSVLDPGRLLDLEASLRRGQRRFEEALALLDEAVAVGRCPGRYLINKGFTLEVMGEYERAIEALLQAESRPEVQGDPRLRNILRCNLGFHYCHTGCFAEAAELAQKVSDVADEMGDEIGVLRVTWLCGRIAAGQGRTAEALALLAQARRELAAREMWYDVALALLEEAALLLEEGRPAAVKALAEELTEAFASKGVHREALAALRLFHEAAEREEATAELARRVLRYLFQARYDQGLRFDS
jgi:tetratricopeptide (TPR) repeat protein